MAIEIRPAREDELDRVHDVVAVSFTADRSAKGREKFKHVERLAHPTVLLDEGEIVASLRVYDFTTRINGAEIRMGGVSSVSCYPEHRRKGHVGRLLTHALAKMRENGQPLSALYTPHPSLYRKYGYMTAANNVRYTWHPKRVNIWPALRPTGRAERLKEDDWPVLDRVYERDAAGRTGAMRRSETWWREGIFRRIYDDSRILRDVAVWRDASGEPVGYVVYSSERSGHSASLALEEFVALTGDAYIGLLRYVQSHDLADEIQWHGAVDDPLPYVLDDGALVKREVVDDLMLRIVDIPAAIAARPAAGGAPDGSFSVALDDAVCPWNAGTWRIENSAGVLSATPSSGDPDISLDSATFAAVYNGLIPAGEAVRCGLAQAGGPGATHLADRILASDRRPNGSDFF